MAYNCYTKRDFKKKTNGKNTSGNIAAETVELVKLRHVSGLYQPLITTLSFTVIA